MRCDQEQIQKDLQSYVNSALMPCPFAKLPTQYVHLEEELGTDRVREQLREALDRFFPDPAKSILAVVPSIEPETHGKARRQAFLLHLEWGMLHHEETVGKGFELERLRKQVVEWHRLAINDSCVFVGPRFLVGNRDLMGTNFNPLYHPDHPRFAPHFVSPVIRSRDLFEIHEKKPELVRSISNHAKSKIIWSLVKNREGVSLEDIMKEIELWNRGLADFHRFVMDVDTPSFRLDESTRPVMAEIRKIRKAIVPTLLAKIPQVKAQLIKYGEVPTLLRILKQNPEINLLEIARIVYGDTSGHYVLPPKTD